MGLREQNAIRTRQLIATAAMLEFEQHGYDATTMEDVARRADIGISTLYRYFPSKELLGTAFLGAPSLMADLLASRPEDEPAEVALGHAVVAFVENASSSPDEVRIFGSIMEANSRVRARVLEWLSEAHAALAVALAERRGLPADDLRSAAEAWLAIFVIQRSAAGEPTGDPTQGREVVVDVMRELASLKISTPHLG